MATKRERMTLTDAHLIKATLRAHVKEPTFLDYPTGMSGAGMKPDGIKKHAPLWKALLAISPNMSDGKRKAAEAALMYIAADCKGWGLNSAELKDWKTEMAQRVRTLARHVGQMLIRKNCMVQGTD